MGAMRVVQCWDDGVSNDIRLIEILRKHGAVGTFNLNAGTHARHRSAGWEYRDTDVYKLGWDEMQSVYEGCTIANHSLTHPHLEAIPVEDARRDIVEGRKRLQEFFDQPVDGFAYPFGTYNEPVMELLREAGHTYARTTQYAAACFPPQDPMALHSTCKFDDPEFFSHYENARACGVFYFWGHSYEICTEPMWEEFEQKIERTSADPEAEWVTVAELF